MYLLNESDASLNKNTYLVAVTEISEADRKRIPAIIIGARKGFQELTSTAIPVKQASTNRGGKKALAKSAKITDRRRATSVASDVGSQVSQSEDVSQGDAHSQTRRTDDGSDMTFPGIDVSWLDLDIDSSYVISALELGVNRCRNTERCTHMVSLPGPAYWCPEKYNMERHNFLEENPDEAKAAFHLTRTAQNAEKVLGQSQRSCEGIDLLSAAEKVG